MKYKCYLKKKEKALKRAQIKRNLEKRYNIVWKDDMHEADFYLAPDIRDDLMDKDEDDALEIEKAKELGLEVLYKTDIDAFLNRMQEEDFEELNQDYEKDKEKELEL